MSPADDVGKAVIEAGSKSFAAASKLLPVQVREDAWRLYAWCRYCDDLIDGQALGGPSVAVDDAAGRLESLRAATAAALDTDEEVSPAFAALRAVVRRHDIPRDLPFALLDGFGMDVEGRRYERLHDVCTYGFHVAGTVGVMMARVMGVSDRPTLDRACDLGIGLQLTNIARDVMEDADNGRVYLPAEWLREAGVEATPDGVRAAEARKGVAQVAARLLDAADGYYRSARTGIGRLPLRSAWAIASARDIYRDIGRIVRRRGPDAWDQRASAPTSRKLMLLGRGGLVAVATRLPLPAYSREGLWTMPA